MTTRFPTPEEEASQRVNPYVPLSPEGTARVMRKAITINKVRTHIRTRREMEAIIADDHERANFA